MIYQNHKAGRSWVSILLILGMFQLATAVFTKKKTACVSCGVRGEYRVGGNPKRWGACRGHPKVKGEPHVCPTCMVRTNSTKEGKKCRDCYAKLVGGKPNNATWDEFLKKEFVQAGKKGSGYYKGNWIRKKASDEAPKDWRCPHCYPKYKITVPAGTDLCDNCGGYYRKEGLPLSSDSSSEEASSSQPHQCDEKRDFDSTPKASSDAPADPRSSKNSSTNHHQPEQKVDEGSAGLPPPPFQIQDMVHVPPSEPYHEKQQSENCGAHAVRSILASLDVGISKLPEDREFQNMCDEVENAELALINIRMAEEEKHTVLPDGFAHGGVTGMWSKEVLDKILKNHDFELCDQPKFEEAKAFMVNSTTEIIDTKRRSSGESKHWYAIVSYEGCWWNVDSLLRSPRKIGNDDTMFTTLGTMPTAFKEDCSDFVDMPGHKNICTRAKYQVLSVIPKRAEAVRWKCKLCRSIRDTEICGFVKKLAGGYSEPCLGLRADGEMYEESKKALQPVKATMIFPDGKWECGICTNKNSQFASVCLCGTPLGRRRRLASRLLELTEASHEH